jgi:sulfonate transport system permease protein
VGAHHRTGQRRAGTAQRGRAAFGAALSDGSLLAATAFTLGSAALGLALGAVLGLALGTLLGLSRRAARLASLSIEVLRPVPSVALIPLAMLVFGFGLRMEVSVVAFACLWPMLVLTQAAVLQVEPRCWRWRRRCSSRPGSALLDRRPGHRAAAVRGAAPGRGDCAGGGGDGGDRRQPARHGLRADHRAAKPGPGADAGLGWIGWSAVGFAINAAALALQRTVARRMGAEGGA